MKSTFACLLGLSMVSGAVVSAQEPPAAVATAETCTVVMTEETAALPEWKAVGEAMLAKYPGSSLQIVKELSQALLTEAFRAGKARYAAIVARPEEVDRPMVAAMHRASRMLDDDVWGDCVCGIITGASAKDALRIASDNKPLIIKRVLGSTNVDHSRYEHSFCITDWKGAPVREQSGYTEPTQVTYSLDTPEGLEVLKAGLQVLFANQLETQKPQMVVTSSHATQFNLEMPFGIGLIYPAHGLFYQLPTWQLHQFARTVLKKALDGKQDEVNAWATQQKHRPIQPDGTTRVWIAAGNCLFGDAHKSPHSMAVTALSAYTCNQVVGYTVPSWYGEGGWGTLGTFTNSVAGTSLAQAWFLNNQYILKRSCALDPRLLTVQFNAPEFNTAQQHKLFSDMFAAGVKATQENVKDLLGLVHDRDVVALYGDPLWSATPDESHIASPFSISWQGNSSFTVKANRHHKGRCAVVFPAEVNRDTVTGCDAKGAMFTNDFILFDNLELEAGESRTIQLNYK